MRNTIYFLMMVLFISITACDPEEKGTSSDGPFIVVNSSGSFSELDPVTFTIDIEDGVASVLNVEKLMGFTADEDTIKPASLGTLAPVGEGFTFSKTLAELGLDKSGAAVPLFFTTEIGGVTYWERLDVSVRNPIVIGKPFARGAKNAKVDAPVTRDGKTLFIDISAKTNSAPIDAFTVETKVGAAGEWQFIDKGPSGADWGAKDTQISKLDSIAIKGSEYTFKDTVFYRVTAKSGSLTSTATTSIPVGKWVFPKTSAEITMDSTKINFGLVEEKPSMDTIPADISFVLGDGNKLGFTAGTGVEFVASTATVYTEGDRLETQTLFDAGVKLTSVEDVEVGNVFIYKVTRDDKVFYGVLRVTSVHRTNTDNKDSFKFTYKYH